MNYFPDEVIIGFLEVPTEISLIIPTAGCGKKCKGCHSVHHRDAENGVLLTDSIVRKLIEKNKKKISCVCFFSGENYPEDFLKILEVVKGKNLKTSLYSGKDSLEEIDSRLFPFLDYLKIGGYQEHLGPLDSKSTNQRMFRIDKGKLGEDITELFWRNKD